MKKKAVVVLILVAVVGAGVALIMKKRHQLAQETTPQTLPVVVTTQILQTGPVALTLRTTADVQAVRDSMVASRLTAYVTALPLFEGELFKRGDLLARLDMSPPGQGQAQGSSLDADLAAAESNLKAEQERLRRSQALYPIQGISQEQLQSAEAAFAAARARHAAARENLRNATVIAPFAGVVSQRLVQPGDLATPGKPLLKIVDTTSGNRLLVSVPETVQPTALRVGGQTLPLRPWPEAGPQGLRRYEARTQDSAFIPGARIEVRTVVFESSQALFLPRACLFNDDGKSATVLRLPDDKKVEPLRIALAAAGEEGAATLDKRLAGQRVACASPDILTRLAAGVSFRVLGGK
ncbi:efflux RND transporter periplasmic adaptor subunit [Sulfuricella sp.]|uniref:efflux RND transporter periplasmic adaptor subunit n=1 Tax=Sulfuricella sp. TaxID=2099377 RepID=UPI002BB36E8D|nr:efflux RND transporter periplasmic adaptor subunit [Sulfuricella sp.]HUX62242.1 efflux RND transporter periplasmic adaptor subunit [Sulfuricella sp.]